MPFGARSFWVGLASVGYVCVAALQQQAAEGLPIRRPLVLFLLFPLLLWWLWRRTAAPLRELAEVEPSVRVAARACGWGACLWLAARATGAGHPGFDALANLGTGTAATAACWAMARIRVRGGLFRPHRRSRSLDAAGFTALVWAIATVLPGARLILPEARAFDPVAIDYATNAASLASLFVNFAALLRLRLLRRLEIGVADRVAAALALSATFVLLSVPAAFLDIAPPDRVLPVGVLAISASTITTLIIGEPTRVTSALRGILALMLLGTPCALLVGLLARVLPERSAPIALAGAVLGMGVGLVARAVARPLGPEQSRWLTALDAASRGALQPEPDAALTAALTALGSVYQDPQARPKLWRHDPQEVLHVDIAGYLHVDHGQAPEKLYEMALAEPERTLRTEVLEALQVRRPDVRSLYHWLRLQGAFSATVIVDDDDFTGLLLLPQGDRTSLMTLEEARAVRVLADRVSALLAVSSALARSRRRELEMGKRYDTLTRELSRLQTQVGDQQGRHLAFAHMLARRVERTAYSGAARLALEHLQRGAQQPGLLVRCPLGVDVVAWLACAHLRGPNRAGQFVVVDANHVEEHSAEYWLEHASSPLVFADGGTLALLHAQALPRGFQEALARALVNRYSSDLTIPGQLSPMRVLAAFDLTDDERVRFEAGSPLARWFRDSVTLPTLAERGEDVRPLVLELIVSSGGRRDGAPFGIDPYALKLLLDHDWPGNERELEYIVLRSLSSALRRAHGPARVSIEDLLDAGMKQDAEEPASFVEERRKVVGASYDELPQATAAGGGPARRMSIVRNPAEHTAGSHAQSPHPGVVEVPGPATTMGRGAPFEPGLSPHGTSGKSPPDPNGGAPTPRRRRPRAPRRRR